MGCHVNKILAPNGEESQLYNDLVEHFGSEEEALTYWYLPRTPQFKKVEGDWEIPGYTGGITLDDRGEPSLQDVLGYFNGEETKAMTQSKKLLEQYNNTMKNLEKVKQQLFDSLTAHLARISGVKSKEGKENIKALQEFRSKVLQADWIEALLRTNATATKQLDPIFKFLDEQFLSDKPSYYMISKYISQLKSFDSIDELYKAITSSPILATPLAEQLKELSSLVNKKNSYMQRYEDMVKDRVANELHSISRDKNLGLEDVKELLDEAPKDISKWESTLYYAGDSKDKIVSLLAQVIKRSKDKVRLRDIKIRNVAEAQMRKVQEEFPDMTEEALYNAITEDKSGTLISPDTSKFDSFMSKYEGTSVESFLRFYTKAMRELNDYLPNSKRLADGKVAPLTKNEAKSLLHNQVSEVVHDMMKQHWLASEGNSEVSTVSFEDKIPIYMTSEMDPKVYSETLDQLLSEGLEMKAAKRQAMSAAIEAFDEKRVPSLLHSLSLFGHMASNYKESIDIIDVVEGTMKALETRKVIKRDAQGNIVKSKLKDMFSNEVKLDGSSTNAYAMAEALVKTQVFGEKEKKLKDWKVGKYTVDTNKVLRNIRKYNSTLMLGFNFVAATSNILQGESSQAFEVAAGEYFDKKTYNRATREYASELNNLMADVASGVPKSKLNLINEYFDIVGDINEDRLRGRDDRGKLKRLASTSTLMFMSTAGEHMMQTRSGMAMLMKIPTYDINGKEISNVYDSIEITDGVLSFKDGRFVKNEQGELTVIDQNAVSMMSRQIAGVLRQLHGNYNSETSAAWQRNALLLMVGQFRKWIADGFQRRYNPKTFRESTGKEAEGMYRSTGRFLKMLVSDLKTEGFQFQRNWDSMSQVEKMNVARTVSEVGMTIGLGIAAALLSSMGDDDDDVNPAVYYGAYFTNRLMTESMFFYYLPNTWQILKSPAASMTVVEQIERTVTYMLPQNITETYRSGLYKGQNKALVNSLKLVPMYKQIGRIMPEGIKAQVQYFNM